jgi:phosphoserine phosphatase
MDRTAGSTVSAKPTDIRLLAARPGPQGDYVDRPYRAMRGEPEAVSEAVQAAMSKETKDCEAADKATAAAIRDARFAALTANLALKADELDAAMRSAGIDRVVYRQIGHACRALHIGVKMLTMG